MCQTNGDIVTKHQQQQLQQQHSMMAAAHVARLRSGRCPKHQDTLVTLDKATQTFPFKSGYICTNHPIYRGILKLGTV